MVPTGKTNPIRLLKGWGPEGAIVTTDPLGGDTKKSFLPYQCSKNMVASIALRRQLCSLRRIFSGGPHSVWYLDFCVIYS